MCFFFKSIKLNANKTLTNFSLQQKKPHKHTTTIGQKSGNFGQRFCAQGSAAATTKAHDQTPGASCHIDPMPLALLRSRRELNVGGHMENTSSSIAKSTCVSVSARSTTQLTSLSIFISLVSYFDLSARTLSSGDLTRVLSSPVQTFLLLRFSPSRFFILLKLRAQIDVYWPTTQATGNKHQAANRLLPVEVM